VFNKFFSRLSRGSGNYDTPCRTFSTYSINSACITVLEKLEVLIMVALCNRADHYIFCPVISIFLSSFFFFLA